MSAAFPAPVHLLRLPLSRSAEWEAVTSWLGGRPRLGGRPWPRIGGTPLHFLAQIDLAALARLRPGSGLPGTGALAVFGLCDNEAMYDPARDNCRLVHVPDPAAAPPAAPPGVDPETYARQHAHMTGLLATQTAALEEFDRDEPVFRKVAAALVTWADAVPPATLLDDAEAANLASALDALTGRFRAHWDFTRGKPEALTMASLQWLALGPADRHALIPPAAAAVLDRLFRLPSGGYPTCHRMFTGPDEIHDVGLEDTGQVVLLHLASDALLGLGFGDVNPLTVVIGPDDLAQGRLDRACITAAGG